MLATSTADANVTTQNGWASNLVCVTEPPEKSWFVLSSIARDATAFNPDSVLDCDAVPLGATLVPLISNT